MEFMGKAEKHGLLELNILLSQTLGSQGATSHRKLIKMCKVCGMNDGSGTLLRSFPPLASF